MIFGLREILAPALTAAGLDSTAQTWRIGEVWPEALGAQIGSRAVPLRLTDGELLVSVPDAVWRQELSLLAPDILHRLNERLGATVVKRLRLIGAAGAPEPLGAKPARRLRSTGTKHAAAPPPVAARPEIGAALADLWSARARRLVRDGARSQDKSRSR
jgi:hypothetical protein